MLRAKDENQYGDLCDSIMKERPVMLEVLKLCKSLQERSQKDD